MVTEVEQHYKTREAAGLLGVHPKSVQRWIRSGELGPVVMLGPTDYRIPASAINRFTSARNVKFGQQAIA